jgi:hypothetical protein
MNGGGGGQHRHHNNNRPRRFNNNRPQHEGGNDPASVARTRRNATQNREKYQMMARDALSASDRVLAEYYLQHADHYHRVLLALPPEEVRQPHYQQRFNANGEQIQGAEHPPEGAPTSTAGEEALPPAHGLPSFITQPGNPQEE